MDERIYAAMILGAGPGGTGPLVAAAQRGQIDGLLDRGLLVIDRRAAPGAATLERYALNADSAGTSFLECVDSAAARQALGLDQLPPATRLLERYRASHPPLSLVGQHLGRIGEALGGRIAAYPTSKFLPHTTVRRIVLERSATVAVETVRSVRGESQVRRVYRGRSVVLALGGRQCRDDVLAAKLPVAATLGELPSSKLVLTDMLLTTKGLTAAARRLRGVRNPRVTILGGSHSAFSTAWALLNQVQEAAWKPGSIHIVYRSPPRIYYPTLADAHADGYAVGAADMCPRTHRIHRLGGLRGDGRALWRSITRRPGARADDRVALAAFEDVPDLRRLLHASDLVVPAFGYRATTVPVLDGAGHRISLAADFSGPLVDSACRVRRADSASLERVFGIGMASGFLPSGAMGGEASFTGQTNGVWLYQNAIGSRVLEGIDEVTA